MLLEDATIIQLYFDRLESAIFATREKYGRMLQSIAYGILRSREDAEECESDTYLKAWNAIPPTRPAVLSAFLGRITRNLSLDRYDQLRAEKRGGGEIPLLLDELAECLPDGEDFDRASELALKELLNRFLAELSPEARRFFLRRYWFGDTVAEVAERYGCGASKVKMSLLRSRKKLEAALREEEFSV